MFLDEKILLALEGTLARQRYISLYTYL